MDTQQHHYEGLHSSVIGLVETADACPRCGADALIAIGDRIDHVWRWLPWNTIITHISTCLTCGCVTQAVSD